MRISVQDAQERTWHSQSRGEAGECFGALAAPVVASVGKSAASSLLCRSQQESSNIDTGARVWYCMESLVVRIRQPI